MSDPRYMGNISGRVFSPKHDSFFCQVHRLNGSSNLTLTSSDRVKLIFIFHFYSVTKNVEMYTYDISFKRICVTTCIASNMWKGGG